jgi:hypothetical protein
MRFALLLAAAVSPNVNCGARTSAEPRTQRGSALTIAPLAEPAVGIRDKTNAAVSVWIRTFHDAFLPRFLTTVAAAHPAKHCVSQ